MFTRISPAWGFWLFLVSLWLHPRSVHLHYIGDVYGCVVVVRANAAGILHFRFSHKDMKLLLPDITPPGLESGRRPFLYPKVSMEWIPNM